MKIKYIHVSNLDSFARYDVKDAAAAFMDVLQSVGKTLSVVYDNGTVLELKVSKVETDGEPSAS